MLVLFIVIFFLSSANIPIGTIQAILQYVNQISEPITESAYFLNSLQAASASAERVFEFFDEEEISDTASPKHIVNPKGAVDFEHVRFCYRSDAITMQDVNITVRPNPKSDAQNYERENQLCDCP